MMSSEKKVKVLGLTGGIGAGKSVVAKIFTELGIPIFDCDSVAKQLYDTNQDLKQFMIETVGSNIYNTPTGLLNRAMLAKLIFSDRKLLKQVEDKVHHYTVEAFLQWYSKEERAWCGIESAILYKVEDLVRMCDAIVVVEAPESLRIKRVTKRDSCSKEAVKDRISTQKTTFSMPSDQPLFRINNDDIQPLLPQVLHILTQLSFSISPIFPN